MNDIKLKRILLFLFGCIFLRLFFVYITKTISIQYLPLLGYIALLPAIGFSYIYFTGTRQTGPETFGQKIWWNNLRPIHSILYFLFAYFAITKQQDIAWKVLLLDVSIGLFAFTIFHATTPY